MAYDIGPKIGIEGEKQYKQAIYGINKDMAVLGSELKKVTAQFDGNANSIDALRAKSEVYNKQIDTQKGKIENLKAALENSTKEFGENSTQTKNWQIALNKAEADLAKTERQLDANNKLLNQYTEESKKAIWQTEEFKKKTQELGDKISDMGKKVGDAGKSMTKWVTGPIVAAGAGIVALAAKTGDYADRILDLTDITGMSTDAIQEWSYVADIAGVSGEAVASAVSGLVRQLPQLQKEGGKATDALGKMGLSYQELNKLSPDEQVDALMQSLSAMDDPLERNAAGAALFGGAWKDLAPILGMGADEMAETRKEAHELGAVMSKDALDQANDFRKGMERLKNEFGGVGRELASSFIPILTDTLLPLVRDTLIPAFRSVVDRIMSIVEWFANLSPATQKTIGIIVALVASIGPLLVIIGKVIAVVGTITAALPALGAAFAALTGPIGIAVAAIAAIIAIGVAVYKNWDVMKEKAAEVGAAMAVAWESLKDAASGLWETIKQFFTVDIPGAFQSVLDFIKTNWQSLLLLILNPFAGAINLLYELNPKFKAWVDDLLGKFKGWIKGFVDIGKNIVRGVWEGIQAMAAWFREKISGFFSGIVDGVKGLLGIKSPSKVFAQIGGYMAEGLGQGFESEMNDVTRRINNSVPTDVNMSGTYSANAQMGEGIVNGLAGLLGNQTGGNTVINITLDGKTVASVLYDPLRNVARQRGVSFG